MRALSPDLRKQLEAAVLAARRAAEGASRAAVDGLGVFLRDKPGHLDEDQAALRIGLRAKWRQLGEDPELLVAACSYEQWHRLLFARFLAENNLLLHPEYKAPVTLADCDELAAELGEPDGWSVAARFAAEILPGIFPVDDPCFRLRLAPEGRYALEQILDGLPGDVFVAADALGWVYQFWQKDKKDEINASERKIGGADLGPVTQLFTESYMVRFLLENSLGAWWAGHHPASPLVKQFAYLRTREDEAPMGRSFDAWPEHVAEVTVMDPCCGSGHFLVEAFSMLSQMRQEEEKLSPVAAQDAVLRDNLFGLELDARCVQIAMFAIALHAWKTGGGWRELPMPHIACSGMPVTADVEEWRSLANGSERLENALVRLHTLFRDADTLGSLIDPPTVVQRENLFAVDFAEVRDALDTILARGKLDPAVSVLGAAVGSASRAAEFLSRRYTVVVTNVPYLGRGLQDQPLRTFALDNYPTAEADLATVFIERAEALAVDGGWVGLVVVQNWLFQSSYETFRRRQLTSHRWRFLVRLGAGAFQTISGEVVQVCLYAAAVNVRADASDTYVELNATGMSFGRKQAALVEDTPLVLKQHDQLTNPDSIVMAGVARSGELLSTFADIRAGISTGDLEVFVRKFWELPGIERGWERCQGAADSDDPLSGRSQIVLWENENGRLAAWAKSVSHLNHAAQKWRRGKPLWGKTGVAVNMMGNLRTALYLGDRFDHNIAVITPLDQNDVLPLWRYCRSPEFVEAVRAINTKVSIESGTLLNVRFDPGQWRAQGEGPSLPRALSDEPSQWVFHGEPAKSTEPLLVAAVRLSGYRWPEQPAADGLDKLADADGIVCLPAVAGEPSAADRLQQILAVTFGEAWSPSKTRELLMQTGSKSKSLADWLQNDFFRQHCALFRSRPFVWHIWDGLRDGFSALVNYHRLDRRLLEKLTYTYLGQDWVERQRTAAREEVAGAEARLTAALDLQRKLEAILDGEKPYDIYVRWKDLHQQPIGWEPDLDDGVRLNIRPFIEAGVLRSSVNIHWKKDRGKNPDGSERHNDLHLSLVEKRDARKLTGGT